MLNQPNLSIKSKSVPLSEDVKSKIVSLFHQIDQDATGTNYHTSSADMSREILNLEPTVSDTVALRKFVDQYTSTCILGYLDSELVGFALVNERDEDFKSYVPDSYGPLVAIHFVGIHPEHQEQGIAHKLLLYIRRLYTNTLDFSHLVAGSAVENKASQNALESIGMRIHKTTDSVDGDEGTIIYTYGLQL